MAAAANEPVDAELETEEEEQEDEADLGDEMGHVRRLNEADERRLVGAEDDPREQIGRDRREAEPARGETQDAEQRNRDGELSKRHPRAFSPISAVRRPDGFRRVCC